MLNLCSDCPGKTNLNKFLTEYFINNEFDLAENISYKQWISTGRTVLVNRYAAVEEFIAKLDDVYEVFPLHFIAKAQANHIKDKITDVQVPTPHGSSARKYLLHESDFDNVKKLLPSNIKFE